jgi:hypothetical protein
MQNISEAPGYNSRRTCHEFLVVRLAADGTMRAIKQNLHARACQPLPFEYSALKARDVRHTSVKHLQQWPAQALGVPRHEGQQVNAHLNRAQVGCLAQRNCILYILVDFHIVVTCRRRGRAKQ